MQAGCRNGILRAPEKKRWASSCSKRTGSDITERLSHAYEAFRSLGLSGFELAYLVIDRIDGFADVLQRRIAQDLGLPRLRVDLDIDDMNAEARTDATRGQVGAADDRTSG